MATANFDGFFVDYYMNGEGWNKASSIIPSPLWVCKGMPEKNAIFKVQESPKEQIDFANAIAAEFEEAQPSMFRVYGTATRCSCFICIVHVWGFVAQCCV